MNYIYERIESIPCSNINCPFSDETFEQNCCGKRKDGDPSPNSCDNYKPERRWNGDIVEKD